MNGQECVAYSAPQFEQMTVDEILAHFANYGFQDQAYHRLELCDDFIRLVEYALRVEHTKN